MKKNSAPKPTHTSAESGSPIPKPEGDQNAEFLGAVLSLSWQLAIVVLVPVIGGYELDQHFHKSPLLTIIGFIVAIVGVVLVLRQTLNQLNRRTSR